MTAKSEHVKALEAARDRLRPGMLRPDLYMYRWRAIVAEVDALERDGLLVGDGAALVPRELVAPDRPDIAHVGRACFNLGITWKPIMDRLRAAGRRESTIDPETMRRVDYD